MSQFTEMWFNFNKIDIFYAINRISTKIIGAHDLVELTTDFNGRPTKWLHKFLPLLTSTSCINWKFSNFINFPLIHFICKSVCKIEFTKTKFHNFQQRIPSAHYKCCAFSIECRSHWRHSLDRYLKNTADTSYSCSSCVPNFDYY